MKVQIFPNMLHGTLLPPPSKSQGHRVLIAAALAGPGCVIHGLGDSQDIQATQRCMKILQENPPNPDKILDCGESGSTLRFLLPVALALQGGARFTGHGRLMERPQKPYFDLFREKNIFYGYSREDCNLLTVRGRLTPGIYALPGNVSSQFITGLLFALPLLDGDSEIQITTRLESSGYVDMTIEALRIFGIRVVWRGSQVLEVPGRQTYRPAEVTVDTDWSQAAFWCVANELGNQIQMQNLNPQSAQGDKQILLFCKQLHAAGDVTLDVSQYPDLVPALAALAALRAGQTTHLVNAGRLRLKESDRLAAVTDSLRRLGAKIQEKTDSLTLTGVPALQGGEADSYNDHRIAMMLAIAASRASAPVTITGAESVQKSYPTFWEDYEALGGKIKME